MLYCLTKANFNMRKYLLFFSLFLLFSFSENPSKKRISDTLFRYEFYTTDKKPEAKPDKEYFWFKGGAIHNTEYGIGGDLLEGSYLKYYHSNQLAEAGKFKKGLKKGLWKSWFKNGVLQSKVNWSDGQMDGNYYAYDHLGNLTETGKYKRNKKHGRWINYTNKDTLRYDRGILVVKKQKQSKTSKDSLNTNKPEKGFFSFLKKKDKPATDSLKRAAANRAIPSAAPVKKEDKPGFFKRLFTKKDKTEAKPKGNTKSVNQPAKKENTDNFFKRLFTKKNKTQKSNG